MLFSYEDGRYEWDLVVLCLTDRSELLLFYSCNYIHCIPGHLQVGEETDRPTGHYQTPEPVQLDKPVKQDSPEAQEPSPTAFVRRSSRRKRQTQKYSTPPAKASSPRVRNGRRRSPWKQRQTEGLDELLEEKKGTLESLRSAQLGALRSRRIEEQLKRTEERAQARQARRDQREKENEGKRERKEQEREAREATRKKLRLAQGILKEAQRDRARRQREGERQRKQRQLERFKEQKMAERRKRSELLSLPLTGSLAEELSADNDVLCAMAELPPLPELVVGVTGDAIPRLLFVSEFLCSFGEPLKLKKHWSAGIGRPHTAPAVEPETE